MTAPLPEGRYPASASRRGLSRRGGIVLTIVALIAGLTVAYVAYQRFATADVEGTALTFDLVDDSTVSIRFSVTRSDPSEPAVCIVRARSRDGAETGRREVLVPGSDVREIEVQSIVKTTQPPVTGDLYGCSLDVPEYLRQG